MSSRFEEAGRRMAAGIFRHSAQPATLNGAACQVVVRRNVEIISGDETQSYSRAHMGSFLLSEVAPKPGQALVLYTGETFKLGVEVESNPFICKMILK